MQSRRIHLLLVLSLVVAAPTLVTALVHPLQGGGEFDPPHVFQPKTRALASEVNANFSAVAGHLTAFDSRLDEAEPANVLLVSTAGGHFGSIASALASISDASDTNRYLVRVGPGVYEETALTSVPSFVALVGSGSAVTVLRATRESTAPDATAAALELADRTLLADIAIENAGISGTSVGVLTSASGSSTRMRSVRVTVNGAGGDDHFAVFATDSDLRLDDCQLEASGAAISNVAYGALDTGAPVGSPLIVDSILTAVGGTSAIALRLSQTAATLRGSHAFGTLHGIQALANGNTKVQDCTIQTTALSPVYDQTGGAAILSASVHFLGGDPTGTPTLFKYVHCYNALFDPVTDGTGSSVE